MVTDRDVCERYLKRVMDKLVLAREENETILDEKDSAMLAEAIKNVKGAISWVAIMEYLEAD